MASIYITGANLFIRKPFVNGVIAGAPVKLKTFDKHYIRMRITYPFSDVVVANSNAGITSFRAPVKKTICIYNGVDFNRFKNLRPIEDVEKEILQKSKGDNFVAAMVGAFENRKDYDTLIEAAIKICEKNPKIIFLLIGEGSLLPAIKNKVPENISRQIIFTGSRHDIESILQIIDVGLLISPHEGISNSIIEYMASAKPVIATKGGGTAELVKDGLNGYLVDQKSPDQIIEKLKKLIADPELASRLGQNGLKFVHENFHVSKNTSVYVDLYKRLMGKRKK